MPSRSNQARSHLFTIRVWPEEVGEGKCGARVEWRGRIQYAANSETLYFRDWDSMLAFLSGKLDSSSVPGEPQEGDGDEPSS